MNDPPARREDINQILRKVSPEIRAMLLTAHQQQFRVERTRSGHLKVRTPEHWTDQRTSFTPGTPSEYRSTANTKSDLKRIGVRFPA